MDVVATPTGLDAVLQHLRLPKSHAAYGADAQQVETIETHMSWVFLAGAHDALKLKKPVRYPFLDYSTPAARAAACREELRLNERLAPGIYRGLMLLQQRADGRLSLVPEARADQHARTLDTLVWMRRLPRERMLDHVLARGRAGVLDIDALARVLTAFYRRAALAPLTAADYIGRFRHESAACRVAFASPAGGLPAAARVLDAFDAALVRLSPALAARAAGGHLVDGHGDLRPEHVCLLHAPVVIDALEFNAELRQVDPFDEIAFLGLECEIAGAPWVGPWLAGVLARALDDAPGAGLIALYSAHRALLRARLSVAHLLEPRSRTPERWLPQAQRYIDCAAMVLAA